MNLFISWSKEKSRRVAMVLRDWIPLILPDISPFVSSEDISKGEAWFTDVASALKRASFCIICVTREDKDSQWMHFEAGAISNSLIKSKICPLLIDITPAQLTGPLAHFQVTTLSKEEMFKLFSTLDQGQDKPVGQARIKSLLDALWERFELNMRIAMDSKTDDETFWGSFLSQSAINAEIPTILTAKSGIDWEHGKPTTKRGHTPQLTYNEVSAYLQMQNTISRYHRQSRLVHGGIEDHETHALHIPEFAEDKTLIIIGSPHANQFCKRMLSLNKLAGIPFRFETTNTGKCIAVRSSHYNSDTDQDVEYFPPPSVTSRTWEEDVLKEDYGIILKTTNPLDASRRYQVLVLAGNHGFGTESAVNFVANDQRLDILHRISGGKDFGLLFEATVGQKRGLSIGFRKLAVQRDGVWQRMDLSEL